MTKRIATWLAAALLGLTAALAGASPAQAAYSDCPSNNFCLWSATGGTGNGWARTAAQVSGCTSLVGSSVGNDQAESVRNRTALGIHIYEHSDCTGTEYEILPSGLATSGYNLGSFPNQASAVRAVPLGYWYAGVYDYTPAGSEPIGMRSQLDINNPALDTAGAIHSIAQIAAQSADGQQIVEIGWRKTLTAGTHLFVASWENGVFQGYGGNGAGGSGNGFIDYAPNTTTYPGVALANAAPGPVFQIEYQAGCVCWFLGYDGQWVGSYAASNFPVTFNEIGLAQWFGEVSAYLDDPCTNMGSSLLPPNAGSAKIENTAFYSGGSWTATAPSLLSNPDPAAYNATAISGSTDDFRFGGPGFC